MEYSILAHRGEVNLSGAFVHTLTLVNFNMLICGVNTLQSVLTRLTFEKTEASKAEGTSSSFEAPTTPQSHHLQSVVRSYVSMVKASLYVMFASYILNI